MAKSPFLLGLAVGALALVTACGGGGGSSVPTSGSTPPAVVATPTPVATGTLPAGFLTIHVAITLPLGAYSAAARRAQAAGTGTTSITFTLVQENGAPATGTPQSFGLTGSSPGCALNSAQALVCTLGVNAPAGTAGSPAVDVFLAQTYDANGNVTGGGAVALSVAPNLANTASIVLSAQVSSVLLVSGGGTLGTAGQQVHVYVIATDSSNNIILNPSTYSSPVYVQLAFDHLKTADVTLTAQYAASDASGSACTPGGTASADDWYQYLVICSPADTVTASFSASGGAAPSSDAYLFGWTSPSQLVATPAPSQSPAPLPSASGSALLDIGVTYPQPSPTPSGPTGSLPVTGV